MAITGSGVAITVLLFVGVMIALMEISKTNQEAEQENRVTTPMIGMTQRNGPWPKCLGMDGEECCVYIEAYARDVRDHKGCEIIGPTTTTTSVVVVVVDDEKKFDPHRVRVYVDEDSIVTDIPDRG
eukprot:CAMPEP_0116853326 /NCGR_PEP_ID=MMETSP0418-20121206/17847_1 /TAXON_ID=1158023 /ORGANISM="Astrosyne radiata, Strain 13vi08-1A" /LENGTH=125 /DNA_ID=CAMNT_0004485709 /DNA_START=31 /DNA_END=408 /DNA_ORIENTATION=-